MALASRTRIFVAVGIIEYHASLNEWVRSWDSLEVAAWIEVMDDGGFMVHDMHENSIWDRSEWHDLHEALNVLAML